MNTHNWIPDVTAEYNEYFGKETITLTGKKLHIKSVNSGTGYALLFGSSGKYSLGGRIEPELVDSKPAEYTVTDLGDETTRAEITMPERFDCVGFLRPMYEYQGVLKAPAVWIERGPPGIDYRDDWIFLFRSPKRQFQWVAEKHELSISHNEGQATASLKEEQGGIAADVSFSGTGYKKLELSVERKLMTPIQIASMEKKAPLHSLEIIGELESGNSSFFWNPKSVSGFDHIALFHHSLQGLTTEFFKDFGLEIGDEMSASRWVLHPQTAPQFYFDGPAIEYSMHLKGHKTLTSDIDTTKLDLISLDQLGTKAQ